MIYHFKHFLIMNKQDKKILKTYKLGFIDELYGKTRFLNFNPILLRAYNLGRLDAIIGDDVSSCDLQTNEEILNKIRKPNN